MKTYIATPLRYPGGKSVLSAFIAQVIQSNNLSGCRYAEPYCGGAGVALNLLLNQQVSSVSINDADKRIYCFWQAVINQPEGLISMIDKTPISVEAWMKQKQIHANADNFSPLEVAFSTLFLNRCNFSGVLNGGIIGGKKQTGKYKIYCRFNKKAIIERINRISVHKSKITLSQKEGVDFIKEMEARDDVFLYIDPPYYEKGKKLYKNWYNDKDHEKLKNLLLSMKEKNWLLSYDNCDFIRKLYATLEPREITLWHHIQTAKKGGELIVHSPTLTITGKAEQEMQKFFIAA